MIPEFDASCEYSVTECNQLYYQLSTIIDDMITKASILYLQAMSHEL